MLKKTRYALAKTLYPEIFDQKDTLADFFTEEIERLTREVRNLRIDNEAKTKTLPTAWFVDPNYVFGIGKAGQVLLNGEQISVQELKNLKSEARALKEFNIYKVMQMTLRQKAIEKAVLTSTDLYSLKGNEQVLAGKMMVFCLDVIKTIINDIDRAKLVAK